MSLTSSLAAPVNVGIRSAHGLLRGGSLQSMARAVGIVLGAGILAASYQLAYDEGRTLIQGMRMQTAHRRARNEAVLLALLETKLPIELQDQLRRSRDVVSRCMQLLTNAQLPENHHTIIHGVLTKVLTPVERSD